MLILKQHHAEHAKIADLTQRVECKGDSQANQYIQFWKRALFICAWLGAIRWVHCCINPATPAVLSSGGRQFAEGLLRLLVHPVQGKVKDKCKYKFKYRDYSGCWCTQGNVKDVQVQSWKICKQTSRPGWQAAGWFAAGLLCNFVQLPKPKPIQL